MGDTGLGKELDQWHSSENGTLVQTGLPAWIVLGPGDDRSIFKPGNQRLRVERVVGAASVKIKRLPELSAPRWQTLITARRTTIPVGAFLCRGETSRRVCTSCAVPRLGSGLR